MRSSHSEVGLPVVSLEHMSANTLNVWLSKFVCKVAEQNGERYPPNSLYLSIYASNRHLSETGGEDAFNVLNKADEPSKLLRVLNG